MSKASLQHSLHTEMDDIEYKIHITYFGSLTEGSSSSCCGSSCRGSCRVSGAFEFTNVIIRLIAIFVIQSGVFISQTVISFIGSYVMAWVCPRKQITSIRSPFQIMHTPSIITNFLVWIPQSSPKVFCVQYMFLKEINC